MRTAAVPANYPPAHARQPGDLLVSVAICTRNRAALMEKAVLSVATQAGSDSEIIIIDNASTDDTAACARRLASQFRFVRYHREETLGLSAARNTALQLSRGVFVVFLDDDATANAGWLQTYVDFAKTPVSARAAVLGGPVVPEYEIEPPAWYYPERNALDLGPEMKKIRAHGGPWGCNIGYHRERALAAGGFDARLGRRGSGMAAHEESELNDRLEKAGYEVWWVPGAGIRHFFPARRLQLAFELRSQFAEGSSAVLGRLRKIDSRGGRLLYTLTRATVAPFHSLLNLLVFVATLPVDKQRIAISNLRQAVRNAGFMAGLLRNLLARPSPTEGEAAEQLSRKRQSG